jgi:hypothetical protein
MIDAGRAAAAATIAQGWVLGSGLVVLLLGLLFWSGHALQLVTLHLVLALTLVLALYTLAVIGAATRAPIRMWAMGFVWVLLVPSLGIGQLAIFPYVGGPAGITAIRALHLLFGLAAIGTGYGLGAAIRRETRAARPPRPIA